MLRDRRRGFHHGRRRRGRLCREIFGARGTRPLGSAARRAIRRRESAKILDHIRAGGCIVSECCRRFLEERHQPPAAVSLHQLSPCARDGFTRLVLPHAPVQVFLGMVRGAAGCRVAVREIAVERNGQIPRRTVSGYPTPAPSARRLELQREFVADLVGIEDIPAECMQNPLHNLGPDGCLVRVRALGDSVPDLCHDGRETRQRHQNCRAVEQMVHRTRRRTHRPHMFIHRNAVVVIPVVSSSTPLSGHSCLTTPAGRESPTWLGTTVVRFAACGATRLNYLRAVLVASVAVLAAFGTSVLAQDESWLAELRARAEGGDADAQYQLAMQLLTGIDLPRNDTEAAGWALRAAEQDHVNAQFLLGTLYNAGKGVPQDDYEAVAWIRVAAEAGRSRRTVLARTQFTVRVAAYSGTVSWRACGTTLRHPVQVAGIVKLMRKHPSCSAPS